MNIHPIPAKKTILIGLCGRSGAGKSYVCRLFLSYGIPAVDTDAVYREMTGPASDLSPCMRDLVSVFGDSIVLPSGALDRRALSAVVFADGGGKARETLNRITHAHILEKTKEIIEQYAADGVRAVVIDAPLLFESGFDSFCDCTVCVTAPEADSVARILKRDGIGEVEAYQRLSTQISAGELLRRCDYRVENPLGCETLKEQVSAIVNDIFYRFGENGGVE